MKKLGFLHYTRIQVYQYLQDFVGFQIEVQSIF